MRRVLGTYPGYWWLAFEFRNYRLACEHANQRRDDKIGKTVGGKWNFFPVEGARCPDETKVDRIQERIYALDPCSPTDVALLRFSTDGMPEVRKGKQGNVDPWEARRVKMSIWLYHLDKHDILRRRKDQMFLVKQEFDDADRQFEMWNQGLYPGKQNFDGHIRKIKQFMKDDAPFAGAARCVRRIMSSQYEWVDDYL